MERLNKSLPAGRGRPLRPRERRWWPALGPQDRGGARLHPGNPRKNRRARRRMNDDLAVTLAILRSIRRWRQSELAEAAGVTNSAISGRRLELGDLLHRPAPQQGRRGEGV